MRVWRIFDDQASYALHPNFDPLDGQGAALYPGRWNHKGVRLLTTSQSCELAMLELLAKLTPITFGLRLELHLEPLTVAEVVYVLGGVYDYPVERISSELLALLSTGAFKVEHEGAVLDALVRMTTKLDFCNVYLAARARGVGAKVASFDRGFQKLEVELLSLEGDEETSAKDGAEGHDV